MFLSNRKQRTVLNVKSSSRGNISGGVPQGSILGPLLLLMYTNVLTEGLKFTVDTSHFTTDNDPKLTADDMNHDLDCIKLWAHEWRMSLNPDPRKQAVEIIFSTKRDKIEHLDLKLDSRLSFISHINAAIAKLRKAVGILKFLSKYLPRETLYMRNKLYVRPYLDYGDVIYQIRCKEIRPNSCRNFLMQKLESVQYSAAIAVTGKYNNLRYNILQHKVTYRETLYQALGWESLYSRRWSR